MTHSTRGSDPRTLLARGLGWIDRETEALGGAIRPSTSFLRDPHDLTRAGRTFTRDDNPTYLQPEALLNALEGGGGCLLFSSGMAAATALLQSLGPGKRIIVPTLLYSGLRHWLNSHGPACGLETVEVDYADMELLDAVMRAKSPALVWIETPSNPQWQITDMRAVAALAHRQGALVAADNTVATPLGTRPIALGVDVVLHSASKYLNGHADVVAGALVVAPQHRALVARLAAMRNDFGAVLGPFEAWLLLRGMRTLAVRMATTCSNALAVAAHLQSHPEVIEVMYPGLPCHPGHELAVAQMGGMFGGMLSFRVAGGEAAAHRLTGALRVIRQAISFGGLETVIEIRRSMEGADSTTPPDLLRLSVGLEAAEDLIADLDQALAS